MIAIRQTVLAAALAIGAATSANSPAFLPSMLRAEASGKSACDSQVLVNVCTDLNSGWRLNAGESLFSVLGGFRLTMQADGNLVLYAIDDRKLPADILHVFDYTPDVMKLYAKPIWSTGTHVPKEGKGRGSYCEMRRDGNFLVCDGQGKPCFETGTGLNPESFLRLQTDGNLVVYTPNLKALWTSKSAARKSIPPKLPRRATPRRRRGSREQDTRASVEGSQTRNALSHWRQSVLAAGRLSTRSSRRRQPRPLCHRRSAHSGRRCTRAVSFRRGVGHL